MNADRFTDRRGNHVLNRDGFIAGVEHKQFDCFGLRVRGHETKVYDLLGAEKSWRRSHFDLKRKVKEFGSRGICFDPANVHECTLSN